MVRRDLRTRFQWMWMTIERCETGGNQDWMCVSNERFARLCGCPRVMAMLDARGRLFVMMSILVQNVSIELQIDNIELYT